jgi:hypothetical protein
MEELIGAALSDWSRRTSEARTGRLVFEIATLSCVCTDQSTLYHAAMTKISGFCGVNSNLLIDESFETE